MLFNFSFSKAKHASSDAANNSAKKAKNKKSKQAASDLANDSSIQATSGNEPEEVDFTNVDFSQYSGGTKKTGPNGKEFNPWKDFDRKGKSAKQKQRYKPAVGKSVTYKQQ